MSSYPDDGLLAEVERLRLLLASRPIERGRLYLLQPPAAAMPAVAAALEQVNGWFDEAGARVVVIGPDIAVDERLGALVGEVYVGPEDEDAINRIRHVHTMVWHTAPDASRAPMVGICGTCGAPDFEHITTWAEDRIKAATCLADAEVERLRGLLAEALARFDAADGALADRIRREAGLT